MTNQDIETTADNLVTLITAMTTPAFDQVGLGGPQMLPMGNQYVATVQAVEEFNFDETTCPTQYTEQANFYIHVEVAGTVSEAHKKVYAATRYVVGAVKATPTVNGACLGTRVVGVRYGEMANAEPKRLTAVGRVEVVCDYAY
jgi:hypothetical protein